MTDPRNPIFMIGTYRHCGEQHLRRYSTSSISAIRIARAAMQDALNKR